MVMFYSDVHNSSRSFKYINLDLWDLTKVVKHGGGLFVLATIDYLYKRVWVHIFKIKVTSLESLQNILL